jgi:AAA domain-containing protein
MPIHKRAAISHGNDWVQGLDRAVPWIWDGLIAEDAITLLAALEKTGKTTLLSLLLDRRREGGQLLGRTVRPGRTILCSEESTSLWALRQPPLNFGPQLEYHRPLGDNPSPGRWRRFIDHLLELAEGAFDLLVIDTVMSFLPAAQNNPGPLRKALNELRVVSGRPAGVLLLHQTPTARSRSRSRGPLAAFADILIDMQVPPGDRFSRRRQFSGVGRYPGTLQHVAAELNPEGTDYVLLADEPAEPALPSVLETLQQLLRESPTPLTRQEILARWPGEPPRADSLWRCLARGCELGILVRTGAGTKAEAFRYGLAPPSPWMPRSM